MKNTLGLGAIALVCLAVAYVPGCGSSDSGVETPVEDTGTFEETSSGNDTGAVGDTGGGGDTATDDTGGGGDTATDDTGGGDTATDDTGGDTATTDTATDDTGGDTATTDTATDDTGGDTATTDTAVTPDGTTTPTLSIADVTVTEGNTGTTTATFTVTLSAASTSPVTVSYATADGTAKSAGGDYIANAGTLTFPAGTTTQTISVLVDGDTIYETNETFTVDLSSPTGATIADGSATGTITNDDAAPTLAINNVGATEGNTGTKNFTFTVSLTGLTEVPVTVNYATANDTATAGTDYTAATGTLTFAPGDIAKAVTVLVTGDTTNESNEQFLVQLSGAAGATIADASGTGTIYNDDGGGGGLPTLAIANATVTEGNSGTTILNFPVTLSASSTSTVTVNYATVNQTATAPSDFTAATGTLTFAPGETTKNVAVTINGDLLNEANENFFVNLTTPTNATIADAWAQGTITNDDALPSLSINDVSLTEGNSGVKAFTFTVTLSAASGRNVQVQWATAPGTANAGFDYNSASGNLTIAAGATTGTVTVYVRGDTNVETNQTFFVNLSSPVNASIADNQGLGTIQNDD